MYIVITYDIKTDKQRNKLSKDLLQFGIRTQKSFFECEVDGRELTIIKQIAKRYSQDDDLVTIYATKQEKFARIGDVKYLEIDDLVF